MAADILSIIDTAVKIGLGAIISGVVAYKITKLNHNKEIEKSKSHRQRELLEEVASQAEDFSSAVLKYWAYMIEYVRYAEQKKKAPADLESRIDAASKELFTKFSQLSSAEGKLILIGAIKAQELIREFGEFIKEFKRYAWQGNKSLTETELNKYREIILEKRKILYTEIRAAYAIA